MTYQIKCQYCKNICERDYKRTLTTCFDCKVKQVNSNNKKARKNRKIAKFLGLK
jgi:ribosomal protein L23